MLKIQWIEIPEKSLMQNLDSFFVRELDEI
jgi:hypothetical protein